MLTVNHHGVIGHGHLIAGKPNQDFAISDVSPNGEVAYAIVSDGCTGGGRTEMGAMFYALSTAQAIRDRLSHNGMLLGDSSLEEVLQRQHAGDIMARRLYGLDRRDMLATCATAVLTPQGGWACLQGDGVLALVKTDGTVNATRIEWEPNEPPYPCYRDDGFRAYVNGSHGGDWNVPHFELIEASFGLDDPLSGDQQSQKLAISKGVWGTNVWIDEAMMRELAYVVIFSDGVTSVPRDDWNGDRTAIPMRDWRQNLSELLQLKGKGDYAVRRLNRFMKLRRSADDHMPQDDLSMAVIQIAQEE